MKGLRLNVFIQIYIAIGIGVLMAGLKIAESWSQHHDTDYDSLLYATLLAISFAFLIASFGHPEHKKEITKARLIGDYRLEHCFRYTAYFFGGVIVFGVNSNVWWVESLHLLFTGLAIASGYIGLILYPTTRKGHIWSWVGFAFGVGGFLLGFLFHFWSIAWGEVLAAIPLAVWMIKTYKKP